MARAQAEERTLEFGGFGRLALYGDMKSPRAVVLFISGDGGWNLGVVDMARELAGEGTLVVGIDIVRYLRSLAAEDPCGYPAGDFETLSHFVQKSLGLSDYVAPQLVGYSSGATLAYAILVQAPSGTFSGAVSLGFCPDLPLRKPLCRGSGLEATALPKGNGFSFLPTKRSDLRWTALQGDIDQVCDPRQTAEYVAQVPGARLINLPGVGHGFSRPRGYLAQLQQAVEEQKPQPIRAAPEPVKDLPIVELPAAPGSRLAIMITGDGGWTGIDKEIGETLVKDGVAVVGLNSLRYFWTRRTPDSATLDLERILRYYMADWRRDDILLIGYSFGADVLPFMVNRLPADLRQRVRRVALLGPSSYATFEFHIGDWLDKRPADALPTEPEIRALKEVPVLCVYGSDEKKPLCPRVQAGANFTAREFPGGHHFGRDYAVIAQAILGGT